MLVHCICCRKEYSVKGIYTHWDRAHGSLEVKSKYSSGYNGKYHTAQFKEAIGHNNKVRNTTKYGEFKDFTVTCYKCNTEMVVTERDKKFPSKQKYFCSRSCANSKERSDECKAKISQGIQTFLLHNVKVEMQRKGESCKNCNAQVRMTGSWFCSISCKEQSHQKRIEQRRKHLSEKQKYKRECQFTFSIKEFPGEFDTRLIEQHGWYKAANRGNNLSGIARDHRVSIEWGWNNNIPQDIVKHPANCELMIQNQNQRKRTNCSISIDELMQRIVEWDKKWNK